MVSNLLSGWLKKTYGQIEEFYRGSQLGGRCGKRKECQSSTSYISTGYCEASVAG